MKAQVCSNANEKEVVIRSEGKIHRPRSKDVENEIQMYLSKLKQLVPFMPKNRKLSKLEVIQHVIDYICDLQYALETHPAGRAMAKSPLTPANRQPLGVIASNSISPNTCASQEASLSMSSPELSEKVLSSDSSPVSC